MRTFLIVAGAVWLSLAALMVFALAAAAARQIPGVPRRGLRAVKPMKSPSAPESGTKAASGQMEIETLAAK